jgi:hypothetical protein
MKFSWFLKMLTGLPWLFINSCMSLSNVKLLLCALFRKVVSGVVFATVLHTFTALLQLFQLDVELEGLFPCAIALFFPESRIF